MAKINKPQSDMEVFEVMKEYCKKKGYKFSNTQLSYMAESCYLLYESRGWKNVTYWPAVAMKWVLTNVHSQQTGKIDVRGNTPHKGEMKREGKSVRDKIMEAEQDNDGGHRI